MHLSNGRLDVSAGHHSCCVSTSSLIKCKRVGVLVIIVRLLQQNIPITNVLILAVRAFTNKSSGSRGESDVVI